MDGKGEDGIREPYKHRLNGESMSIRGRGPGCGVDSPRTLPAEYTSMCVDWKATEEKMPKDIHY